MSSGQNLVATAIMDAMVSEQEGRHKRIRSAQDHYDGLWGAPLARTRLDPGAKDNTTVNYARKTVDTSAYYLFGREVGFEAITGSNQPSEADPEEDSDEEVWLEQCWDANDKMEFLLELATGAGVAGDGFVRVLPPIAKGGFPRLVDLDPQNVDVVWDPADYKNILQFKIQWTGIDPDSGMPVTYRHLIDQVRDGKWETTEQSSFGDSRIWSTIEGPSIWPYSFCPIFHAKNRPAPHQYYGLSDLEDDVLRINAAINFILSNINRILRAHGHPLTVIAGQASSEISRAIADVLFLPNADAKVSNVEMISDLSSSQEQLKRLHEAYHELTSIPEVTTGKLESVGQLSGLALQILYGPLVALTTVKRTYFGTMLRKLCLALLEMGGFTTVTDVQLQWPNILPSDRGAEANTAVALHQAGVSTDTVLSELGYNPVDEANKRSAENESVADLAMQKFDAGDDDGSDPTAGGAA